MPKKKASKKASKKKPVEFDDEPNLRRFERAFKRILERLDGPGDKQTRCIVGALAIVAQELNDLNVSASELQSVPESMRDVIHHLEKIDAQTSVSAEVAERGPSKKT